MPNPWAKKPIAILEAEAENRDVQALVTHDGVPLKRTLSALDLVAPSAYSRIRSQPMIQAMNSPNVA